MTNYSDIYLKLICINECEREALEILGALTTEQRKYYDDKRADIKREIRKTLRNIEDPLAKSLRDGGKRTCSGGDGYGDYYEFWYESDDPDMTDEEVADYVDSEYYWSARYPGGAFTHVYWKRTQCGLRVITYNGLDI